MKFKVWVDYYKKYFEVLALEISRKKVYVEADKKGIPKGYVNYDDCKIYQYIGLNTIIGDKEIYVGDLLKDEEGFVWEVLPLGDGMFKIYCSDLNAMESAYPRAVTCELIGTINEKEKLSEEDLSKL